ncbi:hypothetical protein H4R33_001291 [Dimargaris cristalligena]|uniref:CBM1 domain-containing protein n=1 Tax=Dimargaris cristalligena TaxID=215637 RepID=A0A4P9ZZH8_9FUNG|nr:hypothetical protein H4R33_001291 [Dimargaris cristalligena]RKP38838.1 hypothetical protein BJ085DRAFT_38133 [Dimargaris cristalligena]|eukprot:RKP38838.1 hypothetical protein BJ085DRAFT_38133 [Dimargaris cristalligena]
MKLIAAILSAAAFVASVSATQSHAVPPCATGTMRCGGTYDKGFYVCNFGTAVNFQCGPGTRCYQNGDYITSELKLIAGSR